MNKAVLVGRLTRDPEVRYSQGDNTTAVARYTVAVDRRLKETANRQRIYSVRCIRPLGRVCGKIFSSGHAGFCFRSYSDRKLHE